MLINDASITGSLIVNASASFQNISVGGNIIPDETNIRNLGSTDKYFKEIYVSTGSINFVDETGIVGTLNAGTITAIQSNTSSANSRLNSIESVSASLQSFTASISETNTFTSSATARLNALETTSASIDTLNSTQNNRLGSLETISASNISRISALETTSASVDTLNSTQNARLSALETTSASVDTLNTTQNSRLTSLEITTGSLATTGSNTFIGTQTITGSLFISANLVVQGSSSLQNITASAVSIGTNIVNLNTANPAIRYAGLVIGDSGSVGGSGSFLYDSVQDEMLFIHRGDSAVVTSSVALMGPETYDNLGNEIYLTNNRLPKGTGKEHLVDSCIIDNGTTTCITNNLIGTGTACFASTICVPRLQVVNTNSIIVIEGTSTNGEGTLTIAGKNSSGTCRSAIFKYDNEDVIRISTANAIPIRFETSDVTRMTIASNGISTFACQIQTNGGCVTVNKGDGTPAVLQLGNAQNSFQIQFTCTGGQRIAFINGAPTEFASFYGTGISCFAGTICTPLLTVNSAVRLYGSAGGIGCAYIVTATGTNEQPAIILEKAGGFGQSEIRTYYNDVPNYGMAFRAGNTTGVYINSTGYLGIGTSTPTAILHVSGTPGQSNPSIRLTDCSVTGNGGNVFISADKQGVGYNNLTTIAFSHTLKGGASASNYLTIDSTGVSCFASNVCAANFSSPGFIRVHNTMKTFAISKNFSERETDTNYFRISASTGNGYQVMVYSVAQNPAVGWVQSQVFQAATAPYWGGWVGTSGAITTTGSGAGYISSVVNGNDGTLTFRVTTGSNGTVTTGTMLSYIQVTAFSIDTISMTAL